MTRSAARRRTLQLVLVLGLLALLQFFSRYYPCPVTDFVADDWGSLEAGTRLSPGEITAMARTEMDRPLCLLSIYGVFHAFGDNPSLFFALNYAVNTLILVLASLTVFWLRNSLLETLVFGILFCLVPNLTESFHWAHHTPISYMLLAYVAFAACWVRYFISGRLAWTILAALFYAVALFTYESGAALLLVPLALTRRGTWPRTIAGLAPAALAALCWLLWRADILFPGKVHIVNTRDYLNEGICVQLVAHNLKQIVSWWVANNMFDCIRGGLMGFADLDRAAQRCLVATNVLAAIVLLVAVRAAARAGDDEPAPVASGARFLAFGALWFAAGHLVSVFSWTGGRLNFIPAIGLCMVLAPWLASVKGARTALLAIAVILLLPVNQGTSATWHASGIFQRRIDSYVTRHLREIQSRDVVLFDTGQLRQRLTQGLLNPAGERPEAWALYGNALLFRGFAPSAMVKRACGTNAAPTVLHDVEYGARMGATELAWHDRWNPGQGHSTPKDRVYVIDCFAVGSGQVE